MRYIVKYKCSKCGKILTTQRKKKPHPPVHSSCCGAYHNKKVKVWSVK